MSLVDYDEWKSDNNSRFHNHIKLMTKNLLCKYNVILCVEMAKSIVHKIDYI